MKPYIFMDVRTQCHADVSPKLIYYIKCYCNKNLKVFFIGLEILIINNTCMEILVWKHKEPRKSRQFWRRKSGETYSARCKALLQSFSTYDSALFVLWETNVPMEQNRRPRNILKFEIWLMLHYSCEKMDYSVTGTERTGDPHGTNQTDTISHHTHTKIFKFPKDLNVKSKIFRRQSNTIITLG